MSSLTKKIIKDKLDVLIDIILTDGVQPSELADNIFIDPYVNLSFTRTIDNVIGRVVYFDYDDDESIEDASKVVLEYYYTHDKKLVRIDETIKNRTEVIWDRTRRERELINEIIDLMGQIFTRKQVSNFINTLPKDVREKIFTEYSKSA